MTELALVCWLIGAEIPIAVIRPELVALHNVGLMIYVYSTMRMTSLHNIASPPGVCAV